MNGSTASLIFSPPIHFFTFFLFFSHPFLTFLQVWADRDPTWWPPPVLRVEFAGKRALIRFADGSEAWAEMPIPELERIAANELVASTASVPYSYHQGPGRDGYSKTDLGLIAIAGGIFIFVSIYLGLIRKGGLPTDQIQAQEFGQSKARSRVEGKTGVKFADVAGLDGIIEELQEVCFPSWSRCFPLAAVFPLAPVFFPFPPLRFVHLRFRTAQPLATALFRAPHLLPFPQSPLHV